MARRPSARIPTDSLAPLFALDRANGLSLQEQIRRRIIEAIDADVFRPGRKLPSSRKLADELGISRNTVSLAYQQLTAEGHLEARERSGIYVARDAARLRGGEARIAGRDFSGEASTLVSAMVGDVVPQTLYRCPPDWQSFRYPFIEGRYDKSLFPTVEWREASRLALAAREVEDWSLDNGEADDPALIEEIRTKLLPRRGIRARPDELLITVGEQQALALAAQLFVSTGTVVGVEDPGLPDFRQLVAMRGGRALPQPVDDAGLAVTDDIARCNVVHVSPSRQRPTGVTMSMDRREALLAAAKHDLVVIEDDFECELNYLGETLPAMRSLDGGDRVIYVASLSKVLAPGVRLGFMVAPAEVIAAARRLRDLTTRRASPNNQRAAAFFLSLGHYDAMLRRLVRVFEERLMALRDALNHYRPLSIAVAPVKGGTSLWVKGPDGLNGAALMKEAEARGVLIEPAEHFFADAQGRSNMFRLGVTSLPTKRIRDGIAELSAAMVALDGRRASDAADVPGQEDQPCLDEAAIKKTFTGATLLYKTVYGEPCTMVFHADGSMTGYAGYSNEDRDEGRWWTEGGKWFRQWNTWAYGEAAGYQVQVLGARIFWLNDEGRRVDEAVLQSVS